MNSIRQASAILSLAAALAATARAAPAPPTPPMGMQPGFGVQPGFGMQPPKPNPANPAPAAEDPQPEMTAEPAEEAKPAPAPAENARAARLIVFEDVYRVDEPIAPEKFFDVNAPPRRHAQPRAGARKAPAARARKSP